MKRNDDSRKEKKSKVGFVHSFQKHFQEKSHSYKGFWEMKSLFQEILYSAKT